MQNKYQELWCLCEWTNPGHLGESREFESYYMQPMQQGQKTPATKAELDLVRSPMLANLVEQVAPHQSVGTLPREQVSEHASP
jgi:hypothetical protein